MRRIPRPVVAALLPFSLAALAPAAASAQSIIRNPGDHVKSVEIEPHVLLVPWGTPGNDLGFGLGGRLTFPIVDNGFVSSINNSVGIGVGFDWMRYGGYCGYGYYGTDARGRPVYYGDCGKLNRFSIPVVMQWNFYLTKSWSVFGEPGLEYSFYSNLCPDNYPGSLCRSPNNLDPVLHAGGRWHFSQYATLTMRVGWPYISVGISFL